MSDTALYSAAARLHLHVSHLFDEHISPMHGYTERILACHASARAVIEVALALDAADTSFLRFCPFFCYQVFVLAAFVVLKLSTNEFARTLLDGEADRKLIGSSISTLLFGLSKSFWFLVAARCLNGALNGNVVVYKR